MFSDGQRCSTNRMTVTYNDTQRRKMTYNVAQTSRLWVYVTWGSVTLPTGDPNLSSMYWFINCLNGWPPLVWWHSSNTIRENWFRVTSFLSRASTRHWAVTTKILTPYLRFIKKHSQKLQCLFKYFNFITSRSKNVLLYEYLCWCKIAMLY